MRFKNEATYSPRYVPSARVTNQIPMHVTTCSYSLFGGRWPWWQSPQATKWMLCLLAGERKVVSIFSTSSPQCESVGWQAEQDALAEPEWEEWQSRQLKPSCTPAGVRSSAEPTWRKALGAWHCTQSRCRGSGESLTA